MMLSDVCLSVAYIGPKSRTERPRKTKTGTVVAHVTRDSDTTFKVKRWKVKVTRPLCSPPWRVRRLQRWAWERVGRGKLLLRCRLLAARGASAPTGGGEGRRHIVAAARPPTACCWTDRPAGMTATYGYSKNGRIRFLYYSQITGYQTVKQSKLSEDYIRFGCKLLGNRQKQYHVLLKL